MRRLGVASSTSQEALKKWRKNAIQSQEPTTRRRWIVPGAGLHAQCDGLRGRGKHAIKLHFAAHCVF